MRDQWEQLTDEIADLEETVRQERALSHQRFEELELEKARCKELRGDLRVIAGLIYASHREAATKGGCYRVYIDEGSEADRILRAVT